MSLIDDKEKQTNKFTRVITNFFAVVFVSVTSKHDHIRTHENSTVECALEGDVKVGQCTTRIQELSPVKLFQIEDEQAIAQLGKTSCVGQNTTVNNERMAFEVIDHTVAY